MALGLAAAVDGKPVAQRLRFSEHALSHRLVLRRIEHVGDQVSEVLGFGEAEAARGDGGRTFSFG